MKILCGLGNPGDKYAGTRHNVGFEFIDAYAEKYSFPEFKEKNNALVSEKGQGDDKILLIKPLTYMNKSGEALSKFVQFYKLDHSDVCVIYDDVDLPFGQLRFRDEGSAGTHNGMKSIIQCLGSQTFKRLRIGIESRGVNVPEQMDLSSFVLAPFTSKENEELTGVISDGIDLLEKSLA